MIDVMLSHLAAFALGGIAMAQLIALNQRPHPPRRPLAGDESIDVQCLRTALLHVLEAHGWVSCVTPRGEDHLPTFVASLEQMLRRRIDACQRNLPHHITPPERNAHD